MRDIVFSPDGYVRDQGYNCLTWLINCGPYVDVKAWPNILETCVSSQFNGYLAEKGLLLQALCSRSQPAERQALLDMLSTLPIWQKLSITHLLPLAPNETLQEWIPFIRDRPNDSYKLMTHMVENSANRLTLYIKGELTSIEVWRSCMRWQWLIETKNHAIRRVFSTPPRIMGLPTNEP